jgi:hypothetical protein
MLITVGVLLDLLRQIETFLLKRHYDGFLKKGRNKGNSVGRTRQFIDKNDRVTPTRPSTLHFFSSCRDSSHTL